MAVDGLISDPVMRVDKFLQLSRLVKRRAVAHTLCATGRVRINGNAAKPSTPVKPGDVLTISRGDRRLVAKVVAVSDRPREFAARVDVLARLSLDDLRASDLKAGR